MDIDSWLRSIAEEMDELCGRAIDPGNHDAALEGICLSTIRVLLTVLVR